jgi:hypothetical protein
MEVGEVSCRYAHHEHERIAYGELGPNVGFPTRTLSDVSGQALWAVVLNTPGYTDRVRQQW